LIIFLAAVCLPYYLQYAEPYFSPSVINGINIYENSHIVDSSDLKLAQKRLASDLEIEESYPLPGILHAVLISVTGLPYEKVAYIPVAGLGSLLFFVLARYVLSSKSNGYALLLAMTYFGLNVFTNFQALTNGRAILGAIVLVLFVISFIRLLESPGEKIFPWLITCLISAAMAGGTYYTATLAIIIVIIISFAATKNKFRVISRGNVALPRGISTLVLAIFLFLSPPILAREMPALSIQEFLNHTLDAIRARLGAENTGLQGILLGTDLMSQMRLWSLRLIILMSAVSMVLIVASGIRSPEKRNSRQWLYTIIVFGTCCTALPYLLKTSIISTRFLVAFGFLCALSIICNLKKHKMIFSSIVIGLVLIVSVASLSFSLQKGGSFGAKPYAVDKVRPVAAYLSQNVDAGLIAADAGYASNLWILLADEKRNYKVNVSPLVKDALTLKDAQDGSAAPLLDALKRRGAGYLLINTDDRPFFGDTWGYSVNLRRGKWLESLPLDAVYDDGRFLLYRNVDIK